jgi:hypothetical protein
MASSKDRGASATDPAVLRDIFKSRRFFVNFSARARASVPGRGNDSRVRPRLFQVRTERSRRTFANPSQTWLIARKDKQQPQHGNTARSGRNSKDLADKRIIVAARSFSRFSGQPRMLPTPQLLEGAAVCNFQPKK